MYNFYMSKDLFSLFYPKSIAIVGASSNVGKVGGIVLQNIRQSGYKGNIYPVNPNYKNIDTLKCYPKLDLLPEIPDLLIVAVPVSVTLETLREAGIKGVKNAVVFAAGFKEIGKEGELLEEQLKQISTQYSINVIGPNCLGFVNNLCPLNATFAKTSGQPGNIRFISQSGAIASSMFDWCEAHNLGFAEFVTLGNKAVLNENNILQYFLDHPTNHLNNEDRKGLSQVSPIGLYLESIVNGVEFMRLTREIGKRNPIFIIKPGKTAAAAKAMQSHTGAIAGADFVLEKALEQSGVIRCNTLSEFFNLAQAFAWEDAPNGPKIAVISNAGGPAVISADAISYAGLSLTQFGDDVKKNLLETLPRAASIMNPVDVLGDALADRVGKATEIVLQTNQVDALLVILTPQVMTQIGKTAGLIGELSAKYKKPVFCSFIGGGMVIEGEKILNQYKIPSFRFPEEAIMAIGTMWRWRQFQKEQQEKGNAETEIYEKTNEINKIIQLAHEQLSLDNQQATQVFEMMGINIPKSQIIKTLAEGIVFAEKNQWPVVLKLSAPGLLHKTEYGGVVMNITNEQEIVLAWEKINKNIQKLPIEMQKNVSVQIQQDVGKGVEVIVGVKRDPIFGPVLLFGAGGTMAELIGDRNLHILPINNKEAQQLVEKAKIHLLLRGYRGALPFAEKPLYDLIVRFSKLIEISSDIKEMEINPVIITHDSVYAVDGKILLK